MFLLIPNGKATGGLPMVLRIILQFLDVRRARHRDREPTVVLGVLVTRKHGCVVRQTAQRLVECLVHLCWCAFEEPSAAANEKCVAREDGAFRAGRWIRLARGGGVFHIPADRVLGVTGRVQGGNLDSFADIQVFTVSRSHGHGRAVFAPNHWNRLGERGKNAGVAPGMVVMMVCVQNGRQIVSFCQ